jgi:hypothetical protein
LDKETHKALGYLEAKATADLCRMTTRKATARTTAKAEADKNNGGCGWEGGGREADFSAAPLTMRL